MSEVVNNFEKCLSEQYLTQLVFDNQYLLQIEMRAKNIENGKEVFKRFSQTEQRGLADGGRTNVEATIIAGRCVEARESQDERNDRQETDVEAYAKKIGIWFENSEDYLTQKYGEPINSGQESLVYYDENKGVVIKTLNTLQYKDLQGALDSITLHNTYFPESTKKNIGFGMDDETGFQIIFEQPYIIEALKQASQDEITEYMAKLGFEKHNDGLASNYKNDQTLIRDLSPKNVILTPKGRIAVIDAIMRLNTPDLNHGGTRPIANS